MINKKIEIGDHKIWVPQQKIKKGTKVIIPNGLIGVVTLITKTGMVWVKIINRWGGHSKPVKPRTYRYKAKDLKIIP